MKKTYDGEGDHGLRLNVIRVLLNTGVRVLNAISKLHGAEVGKGNIVKAAASNVQVDGLTDFGVPLHVAVDHYREVSMRKKATTIHLASCLL